MAITLAEDLMTLGEAARFVPRRGGRKAHVSSLYRWTTTGCRRVLLESIQCGGSRCTSRQALERFFERLSGRDAAVSSNSKAHARAVAQADAELAEAGI